MPIDRLTAAKQNARGAAWLLAGLWLAGPAWGQEKPVANATPIALVPIEGKDSARVTGALEVTRGRAVIASSGAVSSGDKTTEVTLPQRGVLRVCASTTVKLAADSSVPAGQVAGLMMAIDRGAVEMSFATTRNSDVLMTPDFRILIAGPGAAEVKVRLGERGDTCVDNAGLNAPYVLVSSVFDGGAFRVQPGQRVMFQHGSLSEVVDNEKESCGCPPPVDQSKNEFPLAQSEGLAPLPAPEPVLVTKSVDKESVLEPLVYSSPALAVKPAGEEKPQEKPAEAPKPGKKAKKGGFLSGVGRFFRKLFGAE